MRAESLTIFATVILALGPAAAPARADAYCPNPAHEEAAPVPGDLMSSVAATLGPDAAGTPEGTFVRCLGSTLMACTIGANLDCGLADIGEDNVGAANWCKENPGSAFVPMFATGHATIYEWSCDGPYAVSGKEIRTVDEGGYIAENWKPVR